MLTQIARIFAMLDQPTRQGLWLVCILMLVSTLLEMAGIGLLIPLFQIMLAPQDMAKLPLIGPLAADFVQARFQTAILALCLILSGFYAVKAVALGLIGWHQSHFVFQRQAVFAQAILRFYLNQPYERMMGRNSAELIRNVTILSARLFIKGVLPVLQLGTEVLASLGVAMMLLLIDPVITLAVGTLMAVSVGLFYGAMRRRLHQWGQVAIACDTEAMVWLNQSLGAPKVVRLARFQEFFCARFARPTEVKTQVTTLSLVAPTWPRLALESTAVISLLGVIMVAVGLNGREPAQIIPTLGILAVAAMRLLPSASKIMNAMTVLRENLHTVDVLHDEGFAELSSRQGTPPRSPVPSFRKELRLEDVGYAYPGADAPALTAIDLTIPAGKSIALVGRSGAGKTTLADVILGLIPPSQGRILVDGTDITHDPSGWQTLVGYIPQDIYLLDDTLKRNVALGLDDDQIDLARLEDALRMSQLDRFVTTLPQGVETVLGERGARLSGGQRQRIGIARALYHRPAVLVLDEATSALDAETERDISDSVAALSGEQTIIIIAHRLSTIRHCDKVVLMDQGRILDQGGFDELAARNADFARLVSLSQLPG